MKAVLFDLGNTLVAYYAAPDFGPILRRALHGCVEALHAVIPVDENELFERALALNVERADYVVRPLAQRWGSPAAPWRTELARHNLLAAVDAAVFCVDVGFRKPHRAPFDLALSALECRQQTLSLRETTHDGMSPAPSRQASNLYSWRRRDPRQYSTQCRFRRASAKCCPS